MTDTIENPKQAKKAFSLNEKESEFLKSLVSDFSKEENLGDTQRVLLNLYNKQDKTISDIKSLKSLLKFEKERQKALAITSASIEKEKKLLDDTKNAFATSFFEAISNKKMFDENTSVKQLFQKMIDNKLIDDNKLFKEYLKNAPDVNFQKSINPNSEVSQNANH